MFYFTGKKKLQLLVFIVLSFSTFKITAQTNVIAKNINNFSPIEKKNPRENDERQEKELNLLRIEGYKKAINQNPQDPLIYNNLGTAYARTENFDEAISVLKKALELNPDFASSHYNLGVVYDYQKRFNEAFDSVQKAVLLDGLNPEFRSEKCQLLVLLERYKESGACYEILAQLRKRDMQENNNYGLSLIYDKQPKKALTVLQENYQAFPKESLTNNALGMYYFLDKNYKSALPYFKRAVELESTLDSARYNLALAQLAVKDREAALKNYSLLKKSESVYAERLYDFLFSGMVVRANKE